jgi:predicted TIM-barrel fold metal-dependent hydrolase
MAEQVAESTSQDKRHVGFIDTDIHNSVPPGALTPYLPKRWQQYQDIIGVRGHHGYEVGSLFLAYPKNQPRGNRTDATPPSGLPAGADLDFMREQHLDALNVEYGVLNTYHEVFDQLNVEYAAALCRAMNEWQIAEWLEKEPRLRASIMVPYEDAELAAAEIDRFADYPGFIQVLLVVRTLEPLGRRKYWKMYEAAERNGLPIAIHFGGLGGNAITSSGWPSYYIEDQTSMSQAFQSQMISLVIEGVFERFPNLRIVTMEGGIAWIPSLMWRLDNLWTRLREEVPHLKRPPSEYIREHFYITTQPVEEPDNPKHLLQTIQHIDSDKLMFSTDYPHWDFDDPDRAFPVKLPPDLKRRIYSENARELYQLGTKDNPVC